MTPPYFDASSMGGIWVLPFVLFLGTLALGPLCLKEKWHHFEIPAVIISIFMIFGGFCWKFGLDSAYFSAKSMFFHHYLPFILMMGALYVVSSGIHIQAKGSLTPLHNVIFLFLASVSASLIGTTGASMLLIRPFLLLNRERRHKVHLVIFFIFLVSNVGGALTPIGDPPLFLGFLNGVNFFWTTWHLMFPTLCVTLALLFVFYIFDSKEVKHIHKDVHEEDNVEVEKLTLHGKHNFIFLGLILLSVIGSGMDMVRFETPRNIALFVITLASYFSTGKNIYHMNRFSFAPLREVAFVFLAIFTTLIPIEAMLHNGSSVFSSLTTHVNAFGIPDPLRYYFITGFLSGVLDNAPTYLLFFHMAGGEANALMNENTTTLIAISIGSVFFGALTYIGNAPNLMVKAIAERAHVKMPSFGGYILWSCGILLPILSLFGLLYFRV